MGSWFRGSAYLCAMPHSVLVKHHRISIRLCRPVEKLWIWIQCLCEQKLSSLGAAAGEIPCLVFEGISQGSALHSGKQRRIMDEKHFIASLPLWMWKLWCVSSFDSGSVLYILTPWKVFLICSFFYISRFFPHNPWSIPPQSWKKELDFNLIHDPRQLDLKLFKLYCPLGLQEHWCNLIVWVILLEITVLHYWVWLFQTQSFLFKWEMNSIMLYSIMNIFTCSKIWLRGQQRTSVEEELAQKESTQPACWKWGKGNSSEKSNNFESAWQAC